MRKFLFTVVALALLSLMAPTSATANTLDPPQTYYVCMGIQQPLKAWGSSGAPNVAFLPAGTQFVGSTFGPRTHIMLTEGSLKGTYASTATNCPTSKLGVGDQWKQRAQERYIRSVELKQPSMRTDWYARMAQTAALLSEKGWQSADADYYLARALQGEIGEGGFGVGKAWDAFGDRSVNPADTAYLVSGSEHVGTAVLDAYASRRTAEIEVTYDRLEDVIERMVERINNWPSPSREAACFAYSESPSDLRGGYCVHNVNVSAAWFLLEADRLGFKADTARAHAALNYSLSFYNPAERSWPYQTGRLGLNDPDHNAFMLDKLVDLVQADLTTPAIKHMMSRTLARYEAHTVLAARNCVGSRAWLTEHDANAGPGGKHYSNADRQAYLAWNAAKAAVSCG